LKILVYTLFQDLGLGDFILVRLANLELYHVWMERVESKVVKDEQFKKIRLFHIQWWGFVRKGARNERNLYQDY